MSVIKTIIMKTNYNYGNFINFIETRDDNLALFIYLKVKAITNSGERYKAMANQSYNLPIRLYL